MPMLKCQYEHAGIRSTGPRNRDWHIIMVFNFASQVELNPIRSKQKKKTLHHHALRFNLSKTIMILFIY